MLPWGAWFAWLSLALLVVALIQLFGCARFPVDKVRALQSLD